MTARLIRVLHWLMLPVLFAAVLSAAGCRSDERVAVRPQYLQTGEAQQRPRLSFGVHPLHNPVRLMAMYGPIVKALNSALPEFDIHLEASLDYADYERKLRGGTLAFALPNPYQTVVVAAPGYRVFGKVARDDDFHGLILRRKDNGGLRVPADLLGKTFSCPSRTAVAACMLPLMYLQQGGLDVARGLTVTSVGSQESSILNVVRGMVDAGATWPPPWRAFQREHPELASQLEVAWRTDSLPNNSLMARSDMDPALVKRVAQVLFSLSATEEGRRLLAGAEIAGFEPASEDTYAPVSVFLRRYAELIGPLS